MKASCYEFSIDETGTMTLREMEKIEGERPAVITHHGHFKSVSGDHTVADVMVEGIRDPNRVKIFLGHDARVAVGRQNMLSQTSAPAEVGIVHDGGGRMALQTPRGIHVKVVTLEEQERQHARILNNDELPPHLRRQDARVFRSDELPPR